MAILFYGLFILIICQKLAIFKVGILWLYNYIAFIIYNPFKLLQCHIQYGGYPTWQAPHKPYMGNRGSKLYMAKPFPPYLGRDNLHPAFFAGYAPVLHPFIFSAITFIILYRAEYLCAKKAVSLWLECPVIYGLRLFYLAKRPLSYLIRRCKRYPYGRKISRFFLFSKKRHYSF